MLDRVFARNNIGPEGFEIRCAGKLPRHTDNRDSFEKILVFRPDLFWCTHTVAFFAVRARANAALCFCAWLWTRSWIDCCAESVDPESAVPAPSLSASARTVVYPKRSAIDIFLFKSVCSLE